MKLTPRDRVMLGVAAVLAACAAFYVVAIRPEHRRAAQLQAQIARTTATLTKDQQSVAEGHAAEIALQRTQGDWTAAQRAVPDLANIPALLKLLQHSAAQAHVSMESITLAGGATSAPPASPGAAGAGNDATAVPVALTFKGGYQALNRLINKLDTFVTVTRGRLRAPGPLVGISGVQVSPANGASGHSGLSIQLTATIYQHSAGSTSAPASGAAG